LICAGVLLSIAGKGMGVGSGVAILLWAVLSFSVITLYDVFFEVFKSGRTPGKRLNGLRVVRVEGHPVTFLTSAVRNVLRPLDFLPSGYLLGAIVILATQKNQRIGDVIAGTLVVRERGGERKQGSMTQRFAGPVPTAPAAVAWDTSRITQDEVAAVRQFLDRRHDIEAGSRNEIARTLAERLRPKVTGAPPDLRGEQFLAALLAAKTERTS
jgi:uncharacterized RDD family membrane protein YckC